MTFIKDPALAPAAAPPPPSFPPKPTSEQIATYNERYDAGAATVAPAKAPTQLQEAIRRVPADVHSREAVDTRRAADASRALPQVDERQEQLLRLDVRKRELDDLRDQQERLAARAKSLVLSCRAIEAALAVLDRGA